MVLEHTHFVIVRNNRISAAYGEDAIEIGNGMIERRLARAINRPRAGWTIDGRGCRAKKTLLRTLRCWRTDCM